MGEKIRWEFEEALDKQIRFAGEEIRDLLAPAAVAKRMLAELEGITVATERNVKSLWDKAVGGIVKEYQLERDAAELVPFVELLKGYVDGTHSESVAYKPPASNVTDITDVKP